MCRIQTKVFDRQIRVQPSEFSKGDDTGNTVMPFCIKETDMKRKIRLILFIVAGQHVEGMAIIINVEVTVPSPGCVRIRKMTRTRTAGNTIISTATNFVSIRVGMRMDASAIAGDSKIVRRNQSKFREGTMAAMENSCWRAFS